MEFPILLSRQQQKKQQEQKDRELAEIRKKIEKIADEVIDFLTEKNISVGEYNLISKVIEQKFSEGMQNTELKLVMKCRKGKELIEK